MGEMLSWEWVRKEWEYCEDNGFILMQYTGLKDRNGTEIYEGDIIDAVYLDSPEVVEFKVNDGGPEYRDWLGWTVSPHTDSTKVKVIGNIYENPDLLTEGR